MADEFMKRGISGKLYNYFSKDIVHIINLSQVEFYGENNVMPIDVVISDDRKHPGKKLVVFIYEKDKTKDVFMAWSNREHE